MFFHIFSNFLKFIRIILIDYLNNMKNNLDKRIERMKKEFNLRTMIVVTLNDEIVGFSEFVFSNEFSKDLDIDCELCGLYIKNGYKHLGLGSIVFEYVINLFKDNNSLRKIWEIVKRPCSTIKKLSKSTIKKNGVLE